MSALSLRANMQNSSLSIVLFFYSLFARALPYRRRTGVIVPAKSEKFYAKIKINWLFPVGTAVFLQENQKKHGSVILLSSPRPGEAFKNFNCSPVGGSLQKFLLFPGWRKSFFALKIVSPAGGSHFLL
jgi:hypothetical protein